MQTELIALDLDGTLFDSKGGISEKNTEAVRKAAEKGVYVIASTGRPYASLDTALLSSLGIKYALTTNGAAVYTVPEKECLYSCCMDFRAAADILEMLSEYDIYCEAFIKGNAYGQRDKLDYVDLTELSDRTKAYIRTTREFPENLAAFVLENRLDTEKICIDFIKKDGVYLYREEIGKRLEGFDNITVVSGGLGNLEITRKGVSKGTTFLGFTEKLGVSRENTMVCGDSENDIDILRAAGFAVAMENGTDDVKSIADFVTKSCDEDGVAFAIEKFVLKG